jgi:MtfA peptidase
LAGLLIVGGLVTLGPLLSRVLEKKTLREDAKPIPTHWEAVLEKSVPLTRRLSGAERTKLLRGARDLIDTLHWEGCGGFQLTADMQLVIAAQACLLTLEIPGEPFPGLREVLVYLSTFVPRRVCDPRKWLASSEPHREAPLLGESWSNGTIVIGWEGALAGAAHPQDGQNVVLHEFAHELASEHHLTPLPVSVAILPAGAIGGMPTGEPVEWRPGVRDVDAWRRVLEDGYQRLCAKVEAGTASVMDKYGATNHSEFFAVATEVFFERARELKAEDPDLYGQLGAFYRQDPARFDTA